MDGTRQIRSSRSKTKRKNDYNFLLKANNSTQLSNSITSGTNVTKNSKYGEPVQMLMSDMK